MKQKMLRRLCLSLVLLIAVLSSICFPDWISSPERGHRGWYGYEAKKKKPEQKKKKKQTKESKPAPQITWPTPDELAHMKVEQIRKWINRASDEAISNPTEANIKRWIEYMKVADRKATEFAGMWAWVMQNNPDLYKESALYPSVAPGSRAYWKLVWKNIEDTLKEKAKDYALLFFHSDDPFSKAQKDILDLFAQQHPDWNIKNVEVTPSIAQKFGIKYTPQIWLLPRKTQKPIPLAAGVVSVSKLEKKIYHTILVLEGKLPPQLAPYQPFKVERR